MTTRYSQVGLRKNDVPATSEQLQFDVFATPIERLRFERQKNRAVPIGDRFERFHRLNPHVYRAFVFVAREYLSETGRSRVGAKMVWEEMRWRFSMRTGHGENDAAMLDNSYVSHYARLAAAHEADLRDAFEFRRLRSAS